MTAALLVHTLAVDPLLDKVDGGVILIVVGKTIVTFVVLLVSVLMVIWWERKLIAFMQSRVGPQEAGPFGLLQSLADGIKAFFKEAMHPDRADPFVYRIAPYLAVLPAFLTFAIVPVGGSVSVFHHTTTLQLADPPVGHPVDAHHVGHRRVRGDAGRVGVGLEVPAARQRPGVGADDLLRGRPRAVGGHRRPCLGVAVDQRDIVVQQATRGIGGVLPNWNIIQLAVVPFVIFLIAATAEINRPPFDLVEADAELVAGYMTEYSAIGFAFFYLAEYMGLINMSAIMSRSSSAGPTGPGSEDRGAALADADRLVPGQGVPLRLFVFVWVRATLPRLRYDQLMDLGWKGLIPWACSGCSSSRPIKEGRWTYALGAAGAGVVALLLLVPGDGGRPRAGPRVEQEAIERGVLLGGRPRRLQGHLRTAVRAEGHDQLPAREAAQARALPRPPRPQPLRGRDGEVHRLRAVRRGVPGPLHLRARRATTRPTRRCRPGERYGFVYEINFLRCIHCDMCVEACPTEAITESKLFEFSFTNRARRHLHQGRAARRRRGPPRQLPWEDWRDGRRRATPAAGCGPPRRAAPRPTRTG